MAELTPLDEKLGEVLGLAQAAQDASAHVSKMEGAAEFQDRLARMAEEAVETELTMAEAAELGHWEIVQKIGETLGDESVTELAGRSMSSASTSKPSARAA